jgi:hypothetical protein
VRHAYTGWPDGAARLARVEMSYGFVTHGLSDEYWPSLRRRSRVADGQRGGSSVGVAQAWAV